MGSDYDNDNDSDIGISFSIQYLDWQLLWQWDLLTEPIDVAVHASDIDFIESWLFGIWIIIFSLVNIFRWAENKKVADRLIEL